MMHCKFAIASFSIVFSLRIEVGEKVLIKNSFGHYILMPHSIINVLSSFKKKEKVFQLNVLSQKKLSQDSH